MHITLEHREVVAGIGGQQREYYVDTTVLFSEEERSIIELRKLYSTAIVVGYPKKPYAPNPFVDILARLAPAVGLLAFGLLITAPFTGLGTLAFLLILASMAMWGYPIWVMYQKLLERQTVTVEELIRGPFQVYAPNPSDAKRVVHPRISKQLINLKDLIMDCAELGEREVIEL